MKASEVIDMLLAEFIKEMKARAKPKQVIDTLDKLSDVMKSFLPKEDIKHIVCTIMQSGRESVMMRKNNRIQFQISRGFGCKFELEDELAILDFIDSLEFNPRSFAVAFCKELNKRKKELKI